jgi:hypothetical protein
MGGWVGLRVGLDAVEKRRILHCRGSNSGRPARSPSLYRLSYPNWLLGIINNGYTTFVMLCYSGEKLGSAEFKSRSLGIPQYTLIHPYCKFRVEDTAQFAEYPRAILQGSSLNTPQCAKQPSTDRHQYY